MKYSLAKYILSVESNDETIRNMFGVISVGGEGTYTDSVTFSRNANMFDTTAYATGAWVHNKNLARNGTVTVSLNQLAEQVSKFIKLAETFYGGDYEGFTLTLTDTSGQKIASAIDCYFTKVPDQSFANSASNQTWQFTCGQINFN